MSIYSLKVCREEHKPLLIDFIRKYWKADHALVQSEILFDFQHYNSLKKEYNFVLGFNTQTNEIDGIIGLIPLSQFDPELARFNETWGGIWRVRSDVKNNEVGMLGVILFEAFSRYSSHGSLGMNEIATRLHALSRYKICALNQYYLLNSECSEFNIATVPASRRRRREIEKSNYQIVRINDVMDVPEGLITEIYNPQKSLTYFLNRFQRHPIYRYSFLGILDGSGSVKAILVTRNVEIGSSRVVRIVDVFGKLENLDSLEEGLQELLIEEAAEYIDFMNYGISPEVFERLGFDLLNVHGNTIIPNYFEPFVRKNIVIKCAYRAPYSDYVMFRADGDQDRPSVIG